MRKRILTLDLVAAYRDALLPMQDIATIAGISRQTVWKRLKKAGITRKKAVTQTCAYCGVQITRPLSRAIKTESAYCCAEHYYASRENHQFNEWRHGSRLARAIVAQHYPLSPGEVVHHKDGNQRNNDLANLQVYASQSDHLAMHHGRKIEPVWDGARRT